MKRDSYSNPQAHASFQPRSPQSANDSTQLSQPVHHSSSSSDLGANWLNKASRWVADKFQTAQNLMGSGDAIAPDQILPAFRGTANRSLSQSAQSDQPLVGVIDSGFGANEHGSKMVEAIQQENPQATIWRGGGVGTGGWSESLVKFVDTAKAGGHPRAVANLSFDLTEVHPDGSTSNRSQLTADEQSALAYARDNNVLIVASSGNQGGAMSALGQASQPSDNLIVVGAANGSDRASYSSYGKGLDLVADVGTAGTSLAAAKTTGAIAKLWSDNPELSSQQVNQMLTATATDLKTPGWDAETGAGLLNSTAAVGLAKTITPKTQMFSGNQLMQQLNKSSEDSTWRSTNGAVASERTAGVGPIALVKPDVDAIREAVDPEPKDLAEIIPGIGNAVAAVNDAVGAVNIESPPSIEQPNPTSGQVAIQQGDTLWDIAQAKLGSGDRWRELRKADGSPFTEQEASQLQVGTSVQIPGAQPDSIFDGITDAAHNIVGIAEDAAPAPAPESLDEVVARVEQAPPEPSTLEAAVARVEQAPPELNLLDEIIRQDAFQIHRAMERDLSLQISDVQQPNELDLAMMEPSNSASGQVTIQQGETLWDIAEAKLGSGDRWGELLKADGSPFTEQEASQLQVGTSVQIPGAQPDSIVDAVNTQPFSPMEQPNLTSAPEPTPPAPPPETNGFSDVLHTVLDVAGLTPIGPIADIANAVVYAVEGDWPNAGTSLLGTFPGFGDAATVKRLADRAYETYGAVEDATETVEAAQEVANGNYDAALDALPFPTRGRSDRSTERADSPPPPQAGGSGGGNQPPQDPPTGSGGSSPTGRADDSNNNGLPPNQSGHADSPPASQSGSSGNSNQPPQDPPIGGGDSPSSSDSEPNDPNINRPLGQPSNSNGTVKSPDSEPNDPNINRPLGQLSNFNSGSSPTGRADDSNNNGLPAGNGDNSGNSGLPPNQSERADSPPEPQSGSSGGGNQPPQDPPIGGGGSPSSSDSEPNDPNINRPLGQPSNSNGTVKSPDSEPNDPNINRPLGQPSNFNETGDPLYRPFNKLESDAAQVAEAARDSLKKTRKTLAKAEDNEKILSGWKKDPRRQHLVEQVESFMYKYEIEFQDSGAFDQGNGGKYKASHAERMAFIEEWLRNPDKPVIAIGVNRALCQSGDGGKKGPPAASCEDFFQDAANVTEKTIVIADYDKNGGKRTRFFRPE